MPKTYRALNQQQLDILLALYKFRFLTRDLISSYQKSSVAYSHYRLTNLLEQKYIGRHYEGKDRLHGKQAVYYLANSGIRFLKQNKELDLNNTALNLMYKDKEAREPFRELCLNTARIFLKLSELYGKQQTFYSKTELMEYDFFPTQLPDGYLLLADKPYFMVQMSSTTTYSGLRGRIGQLVKHFDSGDWDASGLDYPTIVLISDSPYLERQLQGLIKGQLRKHGLDEDDMRFLTTTLKALFGAQSRRAAVYTTVDNKLVPLT